MGEDDLRQGKQGGGGRQTGGEIKNRWIRLREGEFLVDIILGIDTFGPVFKKKNLTLAVFRQDFSIPRCCFAKRPDLVYFSLRFTSFSGIGGGGSHHRFALMEEVGADHDDDDDRSVEISWK